MDWENERYVRLYTRETVDNVCLSWEARAIWHELIKRFDRAGVLEMNDHGEKGLAVLLRMPLETVQSKLPELLYDGRLEMNGRFLICRNYIQAQESAQSDRRRKEDSRKRRAEQAKAKEMGLISEVHDNSVTECDETAPKRHISSQPVTSRHSVPNLAVPSQTKPIRAEPNKDVETPLESRPFREPSQIAFSVTDQLHRHLLEAQPNHRLGITRHWSALRPKWALEVDRMLRLDKRDPKQVIAALDWVFGDQGGSQAKFVIESAQALRTKFDRVIRAMRSPRQHANASPGGMSFHEIVEDALNDERQEVQP